MKKKVPKSDLQPKALPEQLSKNILSLFFFLHGKFPIQVCFSSSATITVHMQNILLI